MFMLIYTIEVGHTRSLATYMRNAMVSLKHANGERVCTIYGRDIAKVSPLDMGPTIAFNLRRTDGSWFGYREVEKLASLSGIQLRTGCFCNPGACAKSLGLSHYELLSNIEAGHVCWDDNDVSNGKPTGAVRISFGYMSTFEDAEKFLKFLINSFVAHPNSSKDAYPSEKKACRFPGGGQSPWEDHFHRKLGPLREILGSKPSDISGRHLVGAVYLKSITIYPIKSCAGFSIESWPLSDTGLLYDREWLLTGSSGEILTQKKVPALCHIRTSIDLQKEKLYVESPHSITKLQISLQKTSSCMLKKEMDIYGQRYEVQMYDNEVNMWFTEAIDCSCTLVRCMSTKNLHCLNKGGMERLCRDLRSKLNFANEAQFLLISEGSIIDLNGRLASTDNQKGNSRSEQPTMVDAMRFRPNLVVSGAEPFAEDNWNSLHIGKAHFISLGGYNRCQMINIDQQSGQTLKAREPLRTLASYRRVQGKILFGVLLRYEDTAAVEEADRVDEDKWIRVGQEVYPSLN